MRAIYYNALPCGCDRGIPSYCEWHLNEPEKRPFKLRVIIESPLNAPDRIGIERNKQYARLCMRDSLLRGEAPFASHLLYDHSEILDDLKPDERELGITAGFEWLDVADLSAVYEDLGISNGMRRGIELAKQCGRKIEYRKILSEDIYL